MYEDNNNNHEDPIVPDSNKENTPVFGTAESPGDKFKEHRKYRKESSKSSYITKKTFVIVLIICMLVTSTVTLLIANHFSAGGVTKDKEISATNYTLSKSASKDLSVQEVIAKNENAVVEIHTEAVAKDSWLRNYVREGAGSGVLIDNDGYIMTCNHVINGASSINVTLKDGSKHSAILVGADPASDIAVIKIKGKDYAAAKYGDSKELSLGDMVVAIGNPLGQLGGSASCGIISSLDRELEIGGRTMNLLQTDASVNPGNSGGGLFDSHGNLIGIVVAKSSGSDIEGIGFAIPINQAANIAKKLIKEGHVSGRASIGIEVIEIPDANSAMEHGLPMAGLYVQKVTGQNAKKAGFKPGDYIYYMDGKKIEGSADMFKLLDKHKPKDKVDFVVIRDNKTIKLQSVLDEA